jgi:uncharacterized membrane protein YkoI
MQGERVMDIKVVVFSVIALAGTAALLVTGLGGSRSEHDADEHEEFEEREHAVVSSTGEAGAILSLEQILQTARQQHAGRVLETELEERRGGMVYEVEILDANGEVWEMRFDARSGEMLVEEQED